MDRIHFTTKDTYSVVNDKKVKIAKLTLRDPEFPMLPDWNLFPDVDTGDYLLVRASSLKPMACAAATKYIFKQVDGNVLTMVRNNTLHLITSMYDLEHQSQTHINCYTTH
jgi:hypothetical protein